MSERSYRVNRMMMAEESAAWPLFQRLVKWGVLIPDLRLQAIATAHKAHRTAMSEGQFRDTENHLFNLLDALTEENSE